MSEGIHHYLARVKREAGRAQASTDARHGITVERDWGKAFRSRPGSDDFAVTCSCGWRASKHYHGETEGWAGAYRHLRREGVL